MKKPLLLGAGLALGCLTLAYAAATDPLAPIGAPAKPATAPVKPTVDTLWGQKVTDNYRYMEALDPSTIAWMKAEGVYTRAAKWRSVTCTTAAGPAPSARSRRAGALRSRRPRRLLSRMISPSRYCAIISMCSASSSESPRV